MIIKDVQRHIIVEGDTPQGTRMNISAGVESHIIRVLTENSYKKPLASSLREAVSNALDSHLEAGVDKPIMVKLEKNGSNYLLSIEDKGLGMDDKFFNKYIMGIGESTKQNNNNLLGGYGCGSKAWLSLVDSFVYVCRKDGMERKYLIFKGREYPESTLVYERGTEEENGVKVEVTLPNSYGVVDEVRKAITTELCYFDNVHVDVIGNPLDWSIYRSKNYQISSLSTIKGTHLTLKNVAYSIDWGKLNMTPLYVSLAIRFDDYEDMQPIFNREELIYTESTIQKIKDKLKEVATEIVTLYNSSISDTDNPFTIFEHFSKNGKIVQIGPSSIDVSILSEVSDLPIISPNMKGWDILSSNDLYNLRELLLWEWDNVATVRNRTVSKKDYHSLHLRNKNIIVEEMPSSLMLNYLRDAYPVCNLIKKKRKMRLVSLNDTLCYYKLLGLKKWPKDKWRDIVTQYQNVEKKILSTYLHIDNIVITEKWLEDRKNNRKLAKRTKVEDGQVVLNLACELERRVKDKYCKFVRYVFDSQNIRKGKLLYVYSTNEEELGLLYEIVKKTNIRVASVSDREKVKIDGMDNINLMSLEKFMVSRHAKKIATYHYWYKLWNNRRLYSWDHERLTFFSPFFDIIKDINNYYKKYKEVNEMSERLMKEGNFQLDIFAKITEVERDLPKWEIFEFISSQKAVGNAETRKFVIKHLKMSKVRLNNKLYERNTRDNNEAKP